MTTLISYPAGIQNTSYPISNTVTTIGSNSFYSCSSLNNIPILNSVTSIESYAFASCTGLETIFLGKNVETIGNYVFRHCISLKCIYFYSKSSPTFGSNVFRYFNHNCNDTWNILK